MLNMRTAPNEVRLLALLILQNIQRSRFEAGIIYLTALQIVLPIFPLQSEKTASAGL